jgi:hypothetical protein
MLPYEPVEGQLIALQHRLLRQSRAMLDPMLNLGLTDVATARRILEEDGFSPAMVKQEIDRYTFRAPGRRAATSTATASSPTFASRPSSRSAPSSTGWRSTTSSSAGPAAGEPAGQGGARGVRAGDAGEVIEARSPRPLAGGESG